MPQLAARQGSFGRLHHRHPVARDDCMICACALFGPWISGISAGGVFAMIKLRPGEMVIPAKPGLKSRGRAP